MLKEKIIENLRRTPSLFYCSTAARVSLSGRDVFNVAGLILKFSGYYPQLRMSLGSINSNQLPLNAPYVYRQWIAYEYKVLENNAGNHDDIAIELPALARQLWADLYGDEAAKQLPFYSSPSPNKEAIEFWWTAGPDYISTSYLINFLQGAGDVRYLRKIKE